MEGTLSTQPDNNPCDRPLRAIPPAVEIDLPGWVLEIAPPDSIVSSDDERMRIAIELSRQNVRRTEGGPFGAVVFDAQTGRLLAAGVNSVVRLNNSSLHAEVVALMFAQRRAGTFTLADGGRRELITSCEPCAMCLGATLWSGVTRLVCGATRDDAMACGFDEGPVFDASYAYLEERGITIARGVCRDEAAAVLTEYARTEGQIYNP